MRKPEVAQKRPCWRRGGGGGSTSMGYVSLVPLQVCKIQSRLLKSLPRVDSLLLSFNSICSYLFSVIRVKHFSQRGFHLG